MLRAVLAHKTTSSRDAALVELPAGSRVGAYTIESVRARLPHLVVYRAVHVVTSRVVAVQVLRPSPAAPSMAEMRRQLAALNRLRHANVAELLEHGELADGRPFVVVEWVAGRSLQTLLAERRVLELGELLAIADEIGAALSAAHALGVAHGELHARNVGLVAHGEHHAVKLVNFGMARLSGTRLAPEQQRGDATVEASEMRADIYAFGALLYQMVTGLRPTADPSPPSVYADVPRGFDEVVLRALRADPTRRWPSVEAMMTDLHACAKGSELVAELHVQAFIDPAVDELELAALDDVEAALELAQHWLEQQSVALVLGGAGAVVATARIPRAIDAQRAARAGWVKLASAVQARVEERPNAHPAVRIRTHIRIDG
jgi:eukaryotic-like serine/threonine-protein kinase